MTARQRQIALSFVVLALAGCRGRGVSDAGQPNRTPAAVTLYAPTNMTETSLTLSWSQSADSDFAAYKLYRASSPGSVRRTWILIDSISTRATTLTTALGLSTSATYYFRIYVCDTGGLCSESNEVSGTTASMDNPWITIPAGVFVMGCADTDTGCASDNSPKHTVSLSDYKIQKYEVTNAQYKQCVDAGACRVPSSFGSRTRTSYYGDPDYAGFPVIFVDWFPSTSYCEWLGGRLPTEAEWEKAARGPSPRENIYPWGDARDRTYANYWDSGDPSDNDTTPVGHYPSGASYYGVMDMAGNVWEWVNDWYDSSYYAASPPNDPQGPPTGSYRALRGGAWYINPSSRLPSLALVASRNWDDPADSGGDYGFRCAQDF